jgi:hypothetical protein
MAGGISSPIAALSTKDPSDSAYASLSGPYDYVATGASMRNLGYGTITETWSGTEVRAYLIWSIIDYGAPSTSGTLNGYGISGTIVGSARDPCWLEYTLEGAGSIYTIVADVTGLVVDGVNALTNFPSSITDGADPWSTPIVPPLIEGASLIVIYNTGGSTWNQVSIYTMPMTLAGESGTETFEHAASISTSAETTFIVSDGQVYGNTASWNGVTIDSNAFPGSDPAETSTFWSMGSLHDTKTYEVPIAFGSTSDSASVGAFGTWWAGFFSEAVDCITWDAQVLSVPVPSVPDPPILDIISGPTFPSPSPIEGTPFTVSLTVRNAGGGELGAPSLSTASSYPDTDAAGGTPILSCTVLNPTYLTHSESHTFNYTCRATWSFSISPDIESFIEDMLPNLIPNVGSIKTLAQAIIAAPAILGGTPQLAQIFNAGFQDGWSCDSSTSCEGTGLMMYMVLDNEVTLGAIFQATIESPYVIEGLPAQGSVIVVGSTSKFNDADNWAQETIASVPVGLGATAVSNAAFAAAGVSIPVCVASGVGCLGTAALVLVGALSYVVGVIAGPVVNYINEGEIQDPSMNYTHLVTIEPVPSFISSLGNSAVGNMTLYEYEYLANLNASEQSSTRGYGALQAGSFYFAKLQDQRAESFAQNASSYFVKLEPLINETWSAVSSSVNQTIFQTEEEYLQQQQSLPQNATNLISAMGLSSYVNITLLATLNYSSLNVTTLQEFQNFGDLLANEASLQLAYDNESITSYLPLNPTTVGVAAFPLSIEQGQSSSLTSTVAGGVVPYTYQWYVSVPGQVGFSAITGANASSYEFTSNSTVTTGEWLFQLQVSDSNGTTVTSPVMALKVIPPVVANAITPSTPSVNPGQSVDLLANPQGGVPPYYYQWFSGSSPICSADTTPLGNESYQSASPSADEYYCYAVVDSAPVSNSNFSATDEVKLYQVPTATSVSCVSPTAVGTSSTCTAKVSGYHPSGNVSFTASGSGTFLPNEVCTLSNGGSCSVSYVPSTTTGSPQTITGTYGGDTYNLPSSGTSSVIVNPAASGTAAFCSSSTVSVGESVECTASVDGSPTGAVDWSVTPAGAVTFSAISCVLNSTFDCTVSVTGEVVGGVTLKAQYMGDLNNNPSNGTVAITVSPVVPSCMPASVVVGTRITCTATVAAYAGNSKPTGTVTWSAASGSWSPTTCKLSSKGRCSVHYTPTTAGSIVLTVSYTHSGATYTGTFALTVTPKPSVTTVSCKPASVSAGSSTTITCTATVKGYGVPTGSVLWSQSSTDGGSVTFTSSPATCTLNAQGSCPFTMTGSTAGRVTIKASYAGNTNNLASTGSSEVTVAKAKTTLSLSCTGSGTSWSCTATLTGFAGTVTGEPLVFTQSGMGKVTFTPASGWTLTSGGTCTVTVTATKAGSVTIRAVYAGDKNNLGSSRIISLKVT